MTASITGQVTTWVAAHGVPAVFLLMALDALLPVGGELIMLYAGVIAAGAVHGSSTSLFGADVTGAAGVYVALAAAGTAGSVVGSLVAWYIGRRGGRPLVWRYGHWLHVTPARLQRAEGWIVRYGGWALFVGRLTPLVRSFISIPAGVLRVPLLAFATVTLIPSAIWCFGFAAGGWAIGSSWHGVDRAFHYLDYVVLAGAALLLALIVVRVRAARRTPSQAGAGE
jgi:membrane protein DedA with SNARE-associated domain